MSQRLDRAGARRGERDAARAGVVRTVATHLSLRARGDLNRLAPLLALPLGGLRKRRATQWRGAQRQQHGVLAQRPRGGRRLRCRLHRMGPRGFRHFRPPDPRQRSPQGRTFRHRRAASVAPRGRPLRPRHQRAPARRDHRRRLGSRRGADCRGATRPRRPTRNPTQLSARRGDDHRQRHQRRRFPARRAAAHRRRARRPGRGVVAVVDLGDRHPDRAVASRDAADAEPSRRCGAK